MGSGLLLAFGGAELAVSCCSRSGNNEDITTPARGRVVRCETPRGVWKALLLQSMGRASSLGEALGQAFLPLEWRLHICLQASRSCRELAACKALGILANQAQAQEKRSCVALLPRTVNGTGHTGPSEFCATSI